MEVLGMMVISAAISMLCFNIGRWCEESGKSKLSSLFGGFSCFFGVIGIIVLLFAELLVKPYEKRRIKEETLKERERIVRDMDDEIRLRNIESYNRGKDDLIFELGLVNPYTGNHIKTMEEYREYCLQFENEKKRIEARRNHQQQTAPPSVDNKKSHWHFLMEDVNGETVGVPGDRIADFLKNNETGEK